MNNPAVIIGNGPTLRVDRLERLRLPSFACNRIAQIYDQTKWRPTYYILTGTGMNDHYTECLQAVHECETAFVWDEYQSGVEMRLPNVRFISCTQAHVSWNANPRPWWWSNDINQGVSKFATSLFAALQIAAALGYGPLYIIGAVGYKAGGRQHFYKDDDSLDELTAGQNNHAIRAAYRLAKRCCPVPIYDSTTAQGFGVFPRRFLEEDGLA